MFAVVVVALALAVVTLASGSPLSSMVCLCPHACTVTPFTPRCDAATVATSNSTSTGLVNWMGANAAARPNVSVVSTTALNCTSSFFELYNSSELLVGTYGLTQSSNFTCDALWDGAGNFTLVLGLRGLGAASPDVYALPPRSGTLYTISAVGVSDDGANALMQTSVVDPDFGCCPLPSSLTVDAGGACSATTATLITATEYQIDNMDTSCAVNTTTVDGNTVYVFDVALPLATSDCPGTALFANTSVRVLQVVAPPAALAVTVHAYGYDAETCPFSPAGYVKPYAVVFADVTWQQTHPVAPTTSVTAPTWTPTLLSVVSPVVSPTQFRYHSTGPTCVALSLVPRSLAPTLTPSLVPR